jgi:hypothetical protein
LLVTLGPVVAWQRGILPDPFGWWVMEMGAKTDVMPSFHLDNSKTTT